MTTELGNDNHNGVRRIEFRCNLCGSGNVRCDAWAKWDIERQEWQLGETYDQMHCHDCESETSCTDVDIDSIEEIKAFLAEFEQPDNANEFTKIDVDDLRDHLEVLEKDALR